MSYDMNVQGVPGESPEETKAREREKLVRWMCGILREKPDMPSRKAFMAKVHSTAAHHGITLEELLEVIEKEDS